MRRRALRRLEDRRAGGAGIVTDDRIFGQCAGNRTRRDMSVQFADGRLLIVWRIFRRRRFRTESVGQPFECGCAIGIFRGKSFDKTIHGQ